MDGFRQDGNLALGGRTKVIGASVPGLLYLEPVQNSTADHRQVRLSELLFMLMKSWRLIALTGAVGLLGAFVLALWQEPVFQSKTQIDIQPLSEASSDQRTSLAGFNPESYLRTQVRILESSSLRQAVLERLKKSKTPVASEPLKGLLGWRNRLFGKSASLQNGHPRVESQVHLLEGSQIIEITTTSPDPQFAAAYTNGLVEEYVDSQLSGAWNAAQKNLLWMNRQLDNLKAKLEGSQQDLNTLGHQAGLDFGVDHTAEVAKMQEELSKAQADRISSQSAFEVASMSNLEDLPQVVNNDRLSGYQMKLSDLRRQVAQLRVQFTPEYYKVREVQVQINETEAALKAEQQSILKGIKNQYLAASRRETMLRSVYLDQQKRISAKNERSAEYDIRKRETDSLRGLYDELLRKVQSAAVSSASHSDWVRVIDAAVPADSPTKPNLPRDSAMGMVTCAFLCSAFVIARGYTQRSLSSPGETARHVGAPELGVIPMVGLTPKKSLDNKGRLLLEDGKETTKANDMSEWDDCPSMAEAYRSTAASLVGSKVRGERLGGGYRLQVLITTSPNRGDGKSTSTVNLGIALAETGRKVVLVDADMRKPRLHEILQSPNNWGLSNILSEDISIVDMPLKFLVRPTGVQGLSMVSSGPGIANVSQVLYSKRVEDFMQRLREEFDFVLIDTPPMLAVADARILGRVADGAILVVRAGETAVEAAINAKERLEHDGIPLIGTLLNAWDVRSQSGYQSYDNSYAYGYAK